MAAMPGLRCELIRGQNLQLVCLTVPTIEVIAAPSFRRDLHVRRSLPVGITVEKCVSNQGVQYCSRDKLIGIGEPGGYSASAIARRGALRDQRIDVGEVEFHRESVDIEI